MLVSDFKVDYRVKNTQRYFSGMHGMSLTRMRRRRKKKDTSCTSRVGTIKIATGATLFNINYEFYGFSGDLIETIN